MLFVKFNNDPDTVYETNFDTVDNHIVSLTGNNIPLNTSGFSLSRKRAPWDNWDYSAYKYIYQKMDDGYMLTDRPR